MPTDTRTEQWPSVGPIRRDAIAGAVDDEGMKSLGFFLVASQTNEKSSAWLSSSSSRASISPMHDAPCNAHLNSVLHMICSPK
jgi:hypothetical protein